MSFYDEFKALIDVLNREGIDYAVCGGVAVAFHGYPRLTDDIDILVREKDLPRITEIVKEVDFILDAGRIPFDVGKPNQREIQRISKVVGEDLLTLDLLIVESVYQPVWDDRVSGPTTRPSSSPRYQAAGSALGIGHESNPAVNRAIGERAG